MEEEREGVLQTSLVSCDSPLIFLEDQLGGDGIVGNKKRHSRFFLGGVFVKSRSRT